MYYVHIMRMFWCVSARHWEKIKYIHNQRTKRGKERARKNEIKPTEEGSMCVCTSKGASEGRGGARFGNAAGFVTSRPRLVRLSGQSADDYYTGSNGNATIIFISRALRGTSDVWRAYRGGVWSRARTRRRTYET